jgi:hypothetical protein
MSLRAFAIASVVLVSACVAVPGTRQPQPPAAPGAAGITMPAAPTPPLPAATPEAPLAAIVTPAPAITVPPNALYVCVTERAGASSQTTIEFEPRVADLCRRHPEMGPCQYEREACRRAGGRVFAANGVEITARTEAEYDRKVTRMRFRAN